MNIEQFRQNSRRLVRELGLFRSSYADTAVTCTQAHILIELGLKGVMNLSQIIEEVQLDKSTASRAVAKMLNKNWISKISSVKDKREKFFELTTVGEKTLAYVNKRSNESVNEALSNLGEEERLKIVEGIEAYSKALFRQRIKKETFLRQIQKNDNRKIAKIIFDILRDEYKETNQEIISMLPECKDLFSFYQRHRSIYYVVEYKNEVVGGAGIYPLKGEREDIAELQKMYLRLDARGKGFASQLLVSCLNFAKKNGYKECYLDTRGNMDAAIKLYQRYGFKETKNPRGKTGHHLCDKYFVLKL